MAAKPQVEASAKEAQAVGELATRILAHMDMGATDEVEHLIRATDRRTLGLVINTWYQMCVAHRGPTTAARTARKTAKFVVGDAAAEDLVAAGYAGIMLIELASADTGAFADTWQKAIFEDPDTTAPVTAIMLGFTRGMLTETPGPDCD